MILISLLLVPAFAAMYPQPCIDPACISAMVRAALSAPGLSSAGPYVPYMAPSVFGTAQRPGCAGVVNFCQTEHNAIQLTGLLVLKQQLAQCGQPKPEPEKSTAQPASDGSIIHIVGRPTLEECVCDKLEMAAAFSGGPTTLRAILQLNKPVTGSAVNGLRELAVSAVTDSRSGQAQKLSTAIQNEKTKQDSYVQSDDSQQLFMHSINNQKIDITWYMGDGTRGRDHVRSAVDQLANLMARLAEHAPLITFLGIDCNGEQVSLWKHFCVGSSV